MESYNILDSHFRLSHLTFYPLLINDWKVFSNEETFRQEGMLNKYFKSKIKKVTHCFHLDLTKEGSMIEAVYFVRVKSSFLRFTDATMGRGRGEGVLNRTLLDFWVKIT